MPMLPHRLHRWWAFALCAAIAGGCGGEDGGSSAAAARGNELPGTQWSLDVAALGVSDPGAVHSWIAFQRGRVNGNDGCNEFSGSYEADGSALSFGPPAGTNKLCGSPADEVARDVLGRLAKVRAYEQTTERLRMQDARGTTLLSYRAETPGVEGRWTVLSVLYDDAIRSVVADTELTADFTPDGTLRGSTGCNDFHGPYTLQGSTLDVGKLSATEKACPSTEATRQETGYLAALESAVRIEQTGPKLTLLNAEGQMAVTLTRPSG